MPDISMCANQFCTMKETCYRFTAKPTPHWQSYFGEDIRNKDGTCDYYWDNKDA